jgi:hypothetical protein
MNTGNPSRGTAGVQLALGANGQGQILDLVGPSVPSAIADAGDINPGVQSAANGSTYRNINGGTNTTFYVKVNGAWVALA